MGFRVRPAPPYRAPATSRRRMVAAILATVSVALSGLALALLIMVLAAGCDKKGGPEKTPAASSSQQTENPAEAPAKAHDSKELTRQLYYPNEDGTRLQAVSRKVTLGKNLDKYTAALQSLMTGPKEKGLVAIFPKNAKLRKVTVENGVAKADFDQSLVKNFSRGSTGEEMLVGSIVDTLTEFPEVKSVQILINGQAVETIAGHMDTSVPLKRMEKLLRK